MTSECTRNFAPGSMARRGLALVICAPSGAGKTTLTRHLREEFPQLGYSLSCTTRAPRADEVDGHDYTFLDQPTFIARRDAGDFAEWACVHGNYYGTPLKATCNQLDAGQDMLFDIDVQGAAQLRLTLSNSHFVFCFPPSMEELEIRLRQRGTDDEASINRRLAAARQEVTQAHWFDAWIVNDDLDTAYEALRSLYITACHAPRLRPQLPTLLLKG